MGAPVDETRRVHAFRRPSAAWNGVAAIAARQHGVIATTQLLSCGLTKDAIRASVQASKLRRLHRGVYAVGWWSGTEPARFMAAVLACPPGTLLSHLAAARLLCLVELAVAEIDVTVAGSGIRSRDGIRAHRCKDLLPVERTVVEEIPVTSVARTLIDIAPLVSPRVLRRAVNQALVDRRTSERALAILLERRWRHPGAATLKRLLVGQAARTRSQLEDEALDLVARHGLPRPRANARVAAGGRRWEVDLVWPECRLAVELDSARFHDNVVARANDAEKTAALRSGDWTVLRLTWSDVVHREAETAARLAYSLTSAGAA